MEGKTVLDLGAGTGGYGKIIAGKAKQVECYDGVANIEDLTNGYVKRADLSEKLNLGVHDWVLSLEVGSHIPQKFERSYFDNIHRHNREGAILSWAEAGQKGLHQLNRRSTTFVVRQMASLGYRLDERWTTTLRKAAKLKWFRKTLMVFRKKTS